MCQKASRLFKKLDVHVEEEEIIDLFTVARLRSFLFFAGTSHPQIFGFQTFLKCP